MDVIQKLIEDLERIDEKDEKVNETKCMSFIKKIISIRKNKKLTTLEIIKSDNTMKKLLSYIRGITNENHEIFYLRDKINIFKKYKIEYPYYGRYNNHKKYPPIKNLSLKSYNFYNSFLESSNWLLHYIQPQQITSSLNYLDLSNSNLNGNDISKLLEELKDNSVLKYLILSNNNISNNGLLYLSEILKVNNTIQYLNLTGNLIDSKGINYLSDVLKNNKGLKYLLLPWNEISNLGTYYLAEAILYNNTLIMLDLSNNQIENIDNQFKKALKVNNTLQYLDLSCNNLGTKKKVNETRNRCISNNFNHFIKFLKRNTSIQYLNLENSSIQSDDIIQLGKSLEYNNTLQYLNLAKNKISGEGIFSLSEALKLNPSLQYLNLAKNELNLKDILSISEALKINKSILYLNLSHIDYTYDHKKYIHVTSIIPLIDVLKTNTTLQFIDLNSSRIDDYYLKEIFNILQKHKNLLYLDLSNKKIFHLINDYKLNLQYLNMEYREFSVNYETERKTIYCTNIRHVIKFLNLNKKLKYFSMFSYIGDRDIIYLFDKIKNNKTLKYFEFCNTKDERILLINKKVK